MSLFHVHPLMTFSPPRNDVLEIQMQMSRTSSSDKWYRIASCVKTKHTLTNLQAEVQYR